MKTICTEQHLNAVSGGTLAAYTFMTNLGAVAGLGIGGITTFIAMHSGNREPGFLAAVFLPTAVGLFVGTYGGHAVGAVGYTLAYNFGTVVSAPIKFIDSIMKPAPDAAAINNTAIA